MNTQKSTDIPVKLLCLQVPPHNIKIILSLTGSRSEEDCQMAWEAVDNNSSGDFTSMITRLAEQGFAAPRIYRAVRLCYNDKQQKKPLPDTLQEIMALAIEHAVRKARR